MKKQLLLFLLVLLPAAAVFSQDAEAVYRKADDYFSLAEPTAKTDSIAAALFLWAADLARKNGRFETAVQSLIKAGSIRLTHHRYPEADTLYRRAIALNDQSINDTALFYQAFLYLGSSFYSAGNSDSASHYFEKASFLSMLHPRSAGFPDQDRLYNSLGTIHFERANYQQAKNYFEKAMRATDPLPVHPDETVVTLQSNIANCLLRLKQYGQAIAVFRQLLRSGIQTRILQHNMAHAYYETGRYDSALHFFSRVSRQNDIVTVRMQNDLGRIYGAQAKWTLAAATLDSSLALTRQLFPEAKNRDRAVNYLIRSLLEEKQLHNGAAIRWCDEALREVHFRFSPRTIYEVPVSETETLSPVTFLELLQQKARLLESRFRATHTHEDLDACLRTHVMATRTASYIRRCFDNDEAKLYFLQDQSAVYHDALRIAHELMDAGNGKQYIDLLVEINEAYKGSTVYDNIRHLELSARVNLPAWVLQKERSLKQSLASYTARLGSGVSSSESQRLRDNIVAVNVELSRVLALYNPDPAYQYFRNHQSPGQHMFSNISKKLDNQTAVISFNVSTGHVYTLAITNTNFKTCTVPLNSSFLASFHSFISEIYGHSEGKRYVGYQQGSEIYNRLIRPLLDVIGSKKKWVMLPDDLISYLPFEALCVDPGDRDYLLFHRQISYHYSFSLLLLQDSLAKREINGRKLFFAPFSSNTAAIAATGLAPLPFSRAEAPDTGITKVYSWKATKSNWLEALRGATVLHLATHAKTGNDKDNSALINFYPADHVKANNNLYIDEIYRLPLQDAQLVVLSACETAGGQRTSGEGLLSLSRAFMYAGAKGIVSSLWTTEDRVTAYLMKQMYRELQKGYPAEVALRNAKLALLADKSISARYKTPDYWSNFVYVGSIAQTSHGSHIAAWMAAIFFLLLMALLVWYKKANRLAPDSFN